MNSETSKNDAAIFDELVQQYATTYRHPDLPPFSSHQHDIVSIHDDVRYPEVLKPGVYALYDHEGTLFYIGESSSPSRRTYDHKRDACKNNQRPPQHIHLITVTEPWERFSLEQFLQSKFQSKFPNFRGRWDEWVKREAQPESNGE